MARTGWDPPRRVLQGRRPRAPGSVHVCMVREGVPRLWRVIYHLSSKASRNEFEGHMALEELIVLPFKSLSVATA